VVSLQDTASRTFVSFPELGLVATDHAVPSHDMARVASRIPSQKVPTATHEVVAGQDTDVSELLSFPELGLFVIVQEVPSHLMMSVANRNTSS
jgi:hypothetical protein